MAKKKGKPKFHDPNTMNMKCESCTNLQYFEGKGFQCEKRYCKHGSQYLPIGKENTEDEKEKR